MNVQCTERAARKVCAAGLPPGGALPEDGTEEGVPKPHKREKEQQRGRETETETENATHPVVYDAIPVLALLFK